MDLNDVLVDLYLRVPREFTAIRAARTVAARDEGEADLARRIARLPKPSAAAWLVNLLSARKNAEIEQLIALGAEMRAAEADLDAADLRRLGKQRLQLIRTIANLGKDLANSAGHRMSAAALIEVEQTLHAAMADDRAADAVRSGRLVRALTASGIEPVDLDGAVAFEALGVPSRSRPALRAVDEDRTSDHRIAGAERKAEEAQASARAAEDARGQLRARRTALSERRLTLDAERSDLAGRIHALDQELAALGRDDDALDRAMSSADRQVEVAVRAAERAEGRLQQVRDARSR